MKHFRAKNRLFRSATWESLASDEGFLNDDIYKIYEELAMGGVGTIVTGLTDVSPYDWSLVGNMRLCSDCLISDYKKLTDTVHKYNCNIWTEINMNEYMRPEWRIVKVGINDLVQEDIKDIISLYRNASTRAIKAGFDGIQLHLAYDWFLNRFINPAYNLRTDLYGGSTENRVRLIKEIVQAIREDNPLLHISAKFSFFDDKNGNFAIEECVLVCKELEKAGIDSLEVLGGHSSKEKGIKHEACYLDLGKAVKNEVNIPIILTGNNHSIEHMTKVLNEENIEFFGLSRPLIREPNLPNRWSNGDKTPAKCVSCSMCYTTYGKRCIFNNIK